MQLYLMHCYCIFFLSNVIQQHTTDLPVCPDTSEVSLNLLRANRQVFLRKKKRQLPYLHAHTEPVQSMSGIHGFPQSPPMCHGPRFRSLLN